MRSTRAKTGSRGPCGPGSGPGSGTTNERPPPSCTLEASLSRRDHQDSGFTTVAEAFWNIKNTHTHTHWEELLGGSVERCQCPEPPKSTAVEPSCMWTTHTHTHTHTLALKFILLEAWPKTRITMSLQFEPNRKVVTSHAFTPLSKW